MDMEVGDIMVISNKDRKKTFAYALILKVNKHQDSYSYQMIHTSDGLVKQQELFPIHTGRISLLDKQTGVAFTIAGKEVKERVLFLML